MKHNMKHIIILGVLPFCTLLSLIYVAIQTVYGIKEAGRYGDKNKIIFKHIFKGLGLTVLISFIFLAIVFGIKGGLW